jgi:hypothetical protein
MTIEYDEKGKFYTNVVTKTAVPSIIQTTTHLIRGLVHIRKGERYKDELDREENFIAVTDASVYDAAGNVLFNSAFLAVQRKQTVWIMPSNGNAQEDLGG